ncbi:MAG: tRNA (adenosine(37)-N6)-threonylcarbamoyltransferase complex ATPase subunit type 1 TsaE [Alphaproteobacteria bacterium]
MDDFFKIALTDLSQTQEQASALATLLQSGDVLCLEGPLGVGKTAFSRALIQSWAKDPTFGVASPTFNLVLTYEGPRGVLWHVDLYRLEEADPKIWELGLEEACNQAIVLLEWPQRLGEAHLKHLDPLWIHLAFGDDAIMPSSRVLRYGGSSRWQQRLAEGGLVNPC